MPTAITPQTATDCVSWLRAGEIPCYKIGGKIKAAYLACYDACMEEIAGSTSTKAAAPRIRRTPDSAAATPITGTETAPRRRGRPPLLISAKRTGTPTTDKETTGNLANMVLAAVSVSGTTRQTVLANPTLKGNRANHISIAITRHLRAGRIAERDGMLYNTAEQRIAA